MFLLGLALFEVAMHVIVGQLEEKGDFGSPLYTVFVGVATAGLTMSVASILTLVNIAEKQLKANREQCED